MDAAQLLEKLHRIEALHAGTSSAGEREAARLAAERIRARLADVRGREPDVELAYSLPDPWTRKLFSRYSSAPSSANGTTAGPPPGPTGATRPDARRQGNAS